MNCAIKIRIYPDKEQRIQIEKTIGCSRFIYNQMLADKISYYQKEKKMLRNTPAGYKKEYPWLKEVDSLALANAQLHLESAFRRFYRADSARNNRQHFGLGLCIAYEIISLHKGTISVLDTPGGGSTFQISLPLA